VGCNFDVQIDRYPPRGGLYELSQLIVSEMRLLRHRSWSDGVVQTVWCGSDGVVQTVWCGSGSLNQSINQSVTSLRRVVPVQYLHNISPQQHISTTYLHNCYSAMVHRCRPPPHIGFIVDFLRLPVGAERCCSLWFEDLADSLLLVPDW